MSSAYNHPIDRARHQARCRAALELLAAPGPQLPQLGDRPRHYVDSRGATRVWVASVGYVAID